MTAPDVGANQGHAQGSISLTYAELAEVLDALTKPQKDALAVLTDGREHYCWKRASDPTARAGRGAVNAVAVRGLVTLKLARFTSYGDPTTGATAVVSDLGQAVWDAL